MKQNDLIPALIWLGLGIAVAVGSNKLKLGTLANPGPGLMPFLLGIVLSLCSLCILIDSIQAIRVKMSRKDEGIWSGVDFKKLIFVLASLLGYALILEVLGFTVTTFLLLLILFKAIGSRGWPFALAGSAFTAILIYLLFFAVLKVELPSGLFRIW